MDSPHPAPAKSSTEVIDKKNTEIKTSANIKNNPVPGNPPKREASTAGSGHGVKAPNQVIIENIEPSMQYPSILPDMPGAISA